MPRIRTIKPELWQDEKLSPLPPLTRLVFLGLICMADDTGRVLDNVRLIDAFLFPETDDSSRESLATLTGIGRIKRGKTSSGQRVLQIANWSRHQKVDHPNLKAALPEIVEEEPPTVIRELVASQSREPREIVAHHTNDQRPTTSDLRPDSVATQPGKPDRENPYAVAMGAVRRHLYRNGEPPEKGDDDRDGSVVSKILRGGRSAEEIAQACEGFRWLCETDHLPWPAGTAFTLRALNKPINGRNTFSMALDAYRAMDSPDGAKRGGTKTIAQLLKHAG